ncbi:MAG TPA: hypothetical protein VFD92_25040 [Candidatus Binatia bacterium]|nr:hypothetical protein [Candidatus Binatia bacterium]
MSAGGADVTSSILCIDLRDPDDELVALIEEAQLWLIAHPVAVRAILRALIEEGRRFAQTPKGRRWRRHLAQSELLRRARVVWDSSLLSAVDARETPPLPSAVIDALVASLLGSDIREVLVRLSEWGLDDG